MSSNNVRMTPVAAGVAAIGNYRWVICALLFFSTTINYIDRNSLSVLKTTLQGALGWNDVDYGWITTAFTFAYAMFPSLIGIFVDKFGVKKALAGALILWSLAAAAHGLVATVIGFVIVRFVLGLAEAANFPASIKAVAMWFPQKERALATGIFNSGTSVGVIVSGGIVADRDRLGLAVGVRVHRRARPHLAVSSGRSISTRRRSIRASSAAELDYIKAGLPPATQVREGAVAHAAALPRDLAVPDRQVHHRSGVVVLSVLAARRISSASAARIRSTRACGSA